MYKQYEECLATDPELAQRQQKLEKRMSATVMPKQCEEDAEKATNIQVPNRNLTPEAKVAARKYEKVDRLYLKHDKVREAVAVLKSPAIEDGCCEKIRCRLLDDDVEKIAAKDARLILKEKGNHNHTRIRLITEKEVDPSKQFHLLVLTYNASNRDSFEDLRRNAARPPNDAPVVVVADGTQLNDQENGRRLAASFDGEFFGVHSDTGEGFNDLRERIGILINKYLDKIGEQYDYAASTKRFKKEDFNPYHSGIVSNCMMNDTPDEEFFPAVSALKKESIEIEISGKNEKLKVVGDSGMTSLFMKKFSKKIEVEESESAENPFGKPEVRKKGKKMDNRQVKNTSEMRSSKINAPAPSSSAMPSSQTKDNSLEIRPKGKNKGPPPPQSNTSSSRERFPSDNFRRQDPQKSFEEDAGRMRFRSKRKDDDKCVSKKEDQWQGLAESDGRLEVSNEFGDMAFDDDLKFLANEWSDEEAEPVDILEEIAGSIFVFDVSDRESYNEALQYGKDRDDPKRPVILIGAQSEDAIGRQVENEEARRDAEKIGAVFYEIMPEDDQDSITYHIREIFSAYPVE